MHLRKMAIILVGFVCIGLSGLSFAQRDPSDLQDIFNRKRIVIAMIDFDVFPFVMSDKKGNLYGFDVEMAIDIAKELDVDIEFNRAAHTFDQVVDIVSRGMADIGISCLSIDLSRSKKVLFTEPYLVLREALLVNRLKVASLNGKIDRVEFLKNSHVDIGVLAGSSQVEFAGALFPRGNVKVYDSLQDEISAAVRGDVHAVLTDELEIERLIHEHPDLLLNLQAVILDHTEDSIAIAVPTSSSHLLSWLNHYVKTKRKEITGEEVMDRYRKILIK